MKRYVWIVVSILCLVKVVHYNFPVFIKIYEHVNVTYEPVAYVSFTRPHTGHASWGTSLFGLLQLNALTALQNVPNVEDLSRESYVLEVIRRDGEVKKYKINVGNARVTKDEIRGFNNKVKDGGGFLFFSALNEERVYAYKPRASLFEYYRLSLSFIILISTVFIAFLKENFYFKNQIKYCLCITAGLLIQASGSYAVILISFALLLIYAVVFRWILIYPVWKIAKILRNKKTRPK